MSAGHADVGIVVISADIAVGDEGIAWVTTGVVSKQSKSRETVSTSLVGQAG